jgi:hypothetical protein
MPNTSFDYTCSECCLNIGGSGKLLNDSFTVQEALCAPLAPREQAVRLKYLYSSQNEIYINLDKKR